MSVLLQSVGLALRLAFAQPQLPVADVVAHAVAAASASTPEVPAELLLGMAYVESRYSPLALSRMEGKRRRVGRWDSEDAPPRLRKGTSLYCGPLQTHASTWSECLAQRDFDTAYTAAATEVTHWLHDRRAHGDLTRALAGYGCGNRGVKTGKCNRYPSRVLWQSKRLEAAKPDMFASRI